MRKNSIFPLYEKNLFLLLFSTWNTKSFKPLPYSFGTSVDRLPKKGEGETQNTWRLMAAPRSFLELESIYFLNTFFLFLGTLKTSFTLSLSNPALYLVRLLLHTFKAKQDQARHVPCDILLSSQQTTTSRVQVK